MLRARRRVALLASPLPRAPLRALRGAHLSASLGHFASRASRARGLPGRAGPEVRPLARARMSTSPAGGFGAPDPSQQAQLELHLQLQQQLQTSSQELAGRLALQSSEFARSTKSEVAPSTVRGVVVDVTGASEEEREFDKDELAREFKVTKRDVRIVDASFRNLPAIVIRDRAIVLNLDLVKAVIGADKAVVMEPWRPHIQELLMSVKERLTVEAHLNEEQPFEFIVLERALKAVVRGIERRHNTIFVAISPILQQAAVNLDPKTYGTLLPFKYSLASLEILVKEVIDALKELLANEEDMAAAYLPVKKETGHPRRRDQHQEMEELLETYLKQAEEIQNQVQRIKNDIMATENIIQIELDSVRNRIMQTSLQLQIATFGLSLGGLGAAFFGMNLLNHFERSGLAFYATSGSISAFTAFAVYVAYRHAKKRNLFR
jgi:magnesium transporter